MTKSQTIEEMLGELTIKFIEDFVEEKNMMLKNIDDRQHDEIRNKQMSLIYKTIDTYAKNKKLYFDQEFTIPPEIIKKLGSSDVDDNEAESISDDDGGEYNEPCNSSPDESIDDNTDVESNYVFEEADNQENALVDKMIADGVAELKKYRQLNEYLFITKKYVKT